MKLSAFIDDKHSLEYIALLFRRAGLEHLLEEPLSFDEVQALADAGDMLKLEQNACLVKMFLHPAKALAQFDGGAALRVETKSLAFALSSKRN
jgi:hypothetical protein